MLRLWTVPDNPPPNPDCFVIPSYALVNRSLPTRPTRAQIEMAARWWQRFPQSKLIMATGDNQGLGVTNAQVMTAYARQLGVPSENLIKEDRSSTTFENLLYSKDIIKAHGLQQPTLVTLDLYTRRAVATAKRQDWQGFYWLSTYSKGEPAYGHKWLQTHSRLTIFCYELGAMAYSKLVGWA
jgi:vancomycin permeability regulator SanA